GIEIDPLLVDYARHVTAEAGVGHLVNFVEDDMFEADLSQATVVTLYLLPDLNLRLRPKLLSLAPGTRIVSHNYHMDDWRPDESRQVGESVVYLWRVPEEIPAHLRERAASDPLGEPVPPPRTHPHFLYPQFRRVAQPSMITTALAEHLWHMVALGGNEAPPSPVTATSSLRGSSRTRGSGNRSPLSSSRGATGSSEFFFESSAAYAARFSSISARCSGL